MTKIMTVLWREHNGLKEHLRTETVDVMWKKHLHRHLTFLKNQTKKKQKTFLYPFSAFLLLQ